MVDQQSRYLIVSLGSIGLRHLRNLRAIAPDSQIAALRLRGPMTDAMPEGCDLQFGSMEEVRAFAPHAAIVAGPASVHLDISGQLVGMGIHVFVEKPLADKVPGVAALVVEARKQGVVLMTGYSLRFMPSLIEARSRILSGEIGNVLSVRAEVGQYLPSWRPGTDYRESVSAQRTLGGGVLLELSHEIDYIYWCFGLPDSVFCVGGKYSALDVDVEDLAEIILAYNVPQRIVSIHLDFLQRGASRQCRFVGGDGTLIWDGVADRIELDFGVGDSRNFTTGPFMVDRNEMYVAEIQHFLRCIDEKHTPLIDGAQGHDILLIVDAARRSMETSRIVYLEHGAYA
jgi:predicted dehydrogenase